MFIQPAQIRRAGSIAGIRAAGSVCAGWEGQCVRSAGMGRRVTRDRRGNGQRWSGYLGAEGGVGR